MSIFWRNVALVATLGVAIVVLFPLGSGPFTATYGPASALRALAYIAFLFALLSTLLVRPAKRAGSPRQSNTPFAVVAVSACAAIPPLRC